MENKDLKKQEELENAKDVILQNLKTSRVEKNLKFIENEVNLKIIDLRSNQYSKYSIYGLDKKITFKTLKKIDLKKQLLIDHQKPNWLSKTEYKKLIDQPSLDKQNEIIDQIVKRYDAFMDKNYTKFIYFDEKQRTFAHDKRQHVLFKISFLITGKLNTGEEIRTPFLLEKVNLVIDHRLRKITIKSLAKKEFLINHIFLTWLANKKDFPIENELKNIPYINQFIEIKETKLLELYAELGISLNIEDFENLSYSPINLRKENNSSKKDRETASHEAKHLLVAYQKKAFIPYVEINNTRSKYGTTLFQENSNNGLSYTDYLAIVIAPLSNKEIKEILDISINKSYGSDAFLANEILDELCKTNDEKHLLLNQVFAKNNQILDSNDFRKKHDLFVGYLLKHKSMDADEIAEQLNSDILIESYYQEANEVKIEKNTFFVEKVDAVALFTNLENDKIFSDTEFIFNKTDFLQNLLEPELDSPLDNSLITKKDNNFLNSNDLNNSGTSNSISEYPPINVTNINWGFPADIHQQEALTKALNEKKVVIQGPPGTGKTQIILNIITNNLFHNKKTLIISEKITAVDVINQKIASNDENLNKFIMDLYNMDEKRIVFYNDLSKILDIYNKNFNEYSAELIQSEFFNKQEKLKIESVHNKIARSRLFLEKTKIDLNDYLQIIDDIPSLEERNLVKNINLSDFKLLDQINFSDFKKFESWNEQRIFFNDLTKSLNYPINNTIIKNVLKIYEKFNAYNELNKFDCLFILLKDQTFINNFLKPIIKIKLAKLSKKNKLAREESFLTFFFATENIEKNISDFEKFLKFDKHKYSEKKLDEYNRLYRLLNTNINPERLKEIYQYFLFIENLEIIKNDFIESDFLNLPLLNNNEKLKLGRYRSTISYKHIIDNKLNANRTLKNEIQKLQKRKNLTKNIKTFIFDNWDDLKVLFPVVLATPENVSNHIPLERDMFDTLIIDESSQMFLERAFPSIFRSKQIIVIGDKNQLQPLKIGERANVSVTNKHVFKYQELVENESILDLFDFVIKGQNNLMLKTHYRSYFESLIRFSNENFYERQLKFIEQKVNDYRAIDSIQIINVKDGIWKKYENEQEANEIIRYINLFFSKKQDLSMGIILFSKKQAGLVKEKLYDHGTLAARKSFEQDDESSLFIKSIDQVQGEERDVIVFGITYGKNTRNYGLLSREHGENRINVATTRAKQKIVLIKSHNADEYPIRETYKSKGPQSLIDFIRFCEKFVTNKSLNNNDLVIGNNTLNVNQNVSKTKELIQQMKKNQQNYQNNNMELKELLKQFLIEYKNCASTNVELKQSLDFWFCFEKVNNFAYYLVDKNLLKDPEKKLWFYNELLKARGYIPKPIYFSELIEFIDKVE